MKTKGFTLVELSIVLVIIGLLISGILVARSMIETAKIQSFIKQIQQFDAAIVNFKTKYSSMPGDSPLMVPAGNGDGLVRDIDDGYLYFSGDISNFWVHLSQSGFDPKVSYTETVGASFNSGGPGVLNAPISVLGAHSVVIPYSTGQGEYNYYITNLTDLISYEFSPIKTGVKPISAAAVDIKIDDGVLNTGTVTGAESTGCGIACLTTQGICADIVNAAQYNIVETEEKCDLKINMLTQTGGNY